MEEFKELKIIGLDENRPPKAEGRGDKSIIHLFLKLSHKASVNWCQDFNRLLEGAIPSVHIKVDGGLFIETWVRKPEEIQGHITSIQEKVRAVNEQYENRLIEKQKQFDKSIQEQSQLQEKIDSIVDSLKFD